MKKKFSLNKNQQLIFLSIASSLVIAMVLVFSILTLSSVALAEEATCKIYYALSFLFLSLSMSDLAIFTSPHFVNKKISFYKYLSFILVYLSFSIAVFSIRFDKFAYSVIGGIYLLTISANRVCKVIENKRIFNKICNSLLAIGAVIISILIFSGCTDEGVFELNIIFTCIILIAMSLVEILVFAFSRMKLGALLKIMRKTYAWEILYGLLILIFTFSFIFSIFEPSIATYGDALWYSFAVVTTIGFGDFTTTTALTRVLSVILGIYGIVVVAVITSIIVNFYNETKSTKPRELEESEIEKADKKEDE